MLDVVLLALALSMDAFAVSIGLGSKKCANHSALAIKAGLYFGFFQALMPLIGYLGGRGLLGWVQGWSAWIAFALLLAIGGKMIYESFAEGVEEVIAVVSHRALLTLAIATSIDALAAGFTLALLPVNPFFSCLIIGITTLFFSVAGVYLGNRTGTFLESKAELFGGLVLILIGIRMLLS